MARSCGRALIEAWYPGQEGGRAIADILLGHVNPSGKLPLSFIKKWEHSPVSNYYPGVNHTLNYDEGIFVEYRYFDHKKIEPLFPFGFGLSYSNFEFDSMKIEKLKLSVKITNRSSQTDYEVLQVYVHPTSTTVLRPEQELKAFRSVFLRPNETLEQVFILDDTAFRYWDDQTHRWKIDSGIYEIRVGNSSRNLPLRQTIRLDSP